MERPEPGDSTDELIASAWRSFRAFDARDMDTLRELAHPELEFSSRLAASEGRTYRGIAGLERYYRDTDDAFDAFERELQTIDRVSAHTLVIRAHVHVVGRGSGIAVDQELWLVQRWEDGLVRSLDVFLDRETAYAAART